MGALLGDGGLELIVTQWDVNDSGVGDHVTGCTELIVTQWDVNDDDELVTAKIDVELIVTQWDVNKLNGTKLQGNADGINSYIVGCKFGVKLPKKDAAIGINSYIVGCKCAR